jgi:two-component system CheB/CheR fusion protein
MAGEGNPELDSDADQEMAGEPSSEPGTVPEQPTVSVAPTKDEPVFIVGVGASAGGLEALQALVREIELDSMAFVVVTHLARNRETMLPALLSRATPLEVRLAEQGMRVRANCVYVLAPGTSLTITGGELQVAAERPDRPRLPVDTFFRSLADDQGDRAIGVILSGSGSDGSFGLKAIRDAGGFTFAQDPKTAQHDGMPLHALRAGAVDTSLSPARIGQELTRIGRHSYVARAPRVVDSRPGGIAQLLTMIRSTFGHDLAQYKPSTIDRRIARRMALTKLEKVDDYVQLVERDADELRTLYRDMLINVTSFFRDPDVFEALRLRVLPAIAQDKGAGSSIRVWVPACSTGEEPYSIAMTIVEALGDRSDHRIQIFATDVSEESIQFARRGLYAEHIALDVSPERLHRFFIKTNADYQVSRRIRDMVVFSTHNVAKDAPFSRLDLVSCRNLLIYLQPSLQKKVMRVLHYALNPHGYLVLGNSETVGDSPELFSLLDRKNRIYLPKHLTTRATVDLTPGPSASGAPLLRPPPARPLANVATLADRKILELYAPPGVVINESLDILHFRGRTGPFLEPAPGEASLNILRLARPELHADLRRTIHQAMTENTNISAVCTMFEDGKRRSFRLEVVPMTEPETRARCLLVLFNEPITHPPEEREPADLASPAEQRIAELERELGLTKEYLQSTIEELESSNEELKSSNEELQSSNEELQSTNEELETSKEEMQSTNEELTSVNDELHMRMNELQVAYDDLHNVMTGADTPVVITGLDLRIRRYTQAAERVLGLHAEDVGRSVQALNRFFGAVQLERAVTGVIQTLIPFHLEALCSDGRWRALNVTPYKTLEHVIKGAVMVITDIDVRHRALQLAHTVVAYANEALTGATEPLIVLDAQTRVVWTNRAYLDLFQVAPEEVIGNLLANVANGQWQDPTLGKLIEATLAAGASFRKHMVASRSPETAPRTYAVSGARLALGAGQAQVVLLSFAEEPLGEPPLQQT